MLMHTDCDIRIASHARHVARVDAVEWMRSGRVSVARTSPRTRLGGALIALGERLAPAAAEGP